MPLSSGTYISDDSKHTVVISSINVSNGSFTAAFTSETPCGTVTFPPVMHPNTGYDFSTGGNTMLVVWQSQYHTEDRSSVICDSWAGCTDTLSTQLLVSGSRGYTTTEGLQEVYSFKDVIFKRQ